MKITIIGCGTSSGVPLLGCNCAVCVSKNIYNKRFRSSIHILFEDGVSLLIDSSPDLRIQALKNDILHLDAVLYTHEHADHLLGIVELRSYNYLQNMPLNIYAHKRSLEIIKHIFPFCFKPPKEKWPVPCLIPNEITPYKEFHIQNHKIMPILFPHGSIDTIGYIINDKIAYCVDLNEMTEKNIQILKEKKLKYLIIDAATFSNDTDTHISVKEVIKLEQQIKPQQIILTHMGHSIGYEEIGKYLCDKGIHNIKPAYDNMTINL